MTTTMSKPVAIVVAALMPSMGIGYKNALPWRLRQEMKYFKQLTSHAPEHQQNAVVMGRKTWESIPPKFRPLPGRVNAVVSRQVCTPGEEKDGALFYASVEEALKQLSLREEVARVFIIGGAEIYAHSLRSGLVDELFVTEITHGALDMDAFLDTEYIGHNFARATHSELETAAGFAVAEGVAEGDFEYRYCLYRRV